MIELFAIMGIATLPKWMIGIFLGGCLLGIIFLLYLIGITLQYFSDEIKKENN